MSAPKDKPAETNSPDDHKRLREAVSALEKRQAELTVSTNKSRDEKTRMVAELQKVQPELKKLKAEQRSLEDLNKKLKQISTELEKRIADKKISLLKREENLRKVERSLEKAESNLKTATTSLQNATTRHEELLESHRRAVAEKEERLTLLQEHWEDLDKRYARLAAMPESDPKALEEWREIEKQKESFSARLIPRGGILARPATRITVVPRGNG